MRRALGWVAGVTALALSAACAGAPANSKPVLPPQVPALAGQRVECPKVAAPGDHAGKQVRGMWIATVYGGDWPGDPEFSVEQKKAKYRKLLDAAKRLQLNTVYVQIRPAGDAFYASPYEPWSTWLTGKAGKNPGWDVLKFLIDEAHARDLEFHAWFNPYRVGEDNDRKKLAPNSPARLHPSWAYKYGKFLWYDPGLPQVRDLAANAVLDVVKKFDIDGVHFDDYFYPYPVAGQVFNDAATYAQYGAGFPTVAEWRRNNINLLIQEIQQRIKAAKPWVKLGISPFAVWRNKGTDPLGSDTTAGVQTYDDLAADTRRWVREEWIDYIVPQVYWAGGFAPADYNKIVPWWAEQVRGTDVHLYIGQATYKVGTSTQSPDWSDPAELSDHLAFNTTVPEVKGDIFFSAKDVRADRLGATSLLNSTWYTRPALIPAMPSLDNRAPLPVHKLRADRTSTGAVQLQWKATSADTTSYAIYRRDLTAGDWCADNDARNLLTTLRTTNYVDTTALQGHRYLYYVTALDRAHNQSVPIPTMG